MSISRKDIQEREAMSEGSTDRYDQSMAEGIGGLVSIKELWVNIHYSR